MKTLGFSVAVMALTISVGQNRAPRFETTPETFVTIPTESHSLSTFTRVKSRVFFVGSTPENGEEPWITDGSQGKTVLLIDINPGPESSNAQNFTRYGDEVFFYANDGVHGMEVWRTDGTQSGTKLVADLVPGAAGMLPRGLSVIDHSLYIPIDSGNGEKQKYSVLTKELQRGESN